jgi:hypothetical protein
MASRRSRRYVIRERIEVIATARGVGAAVTTAVDRHAAEGGGTPVSIIWQYIEQQRSREAAPPPRPKVGGIRRGELR